MEHVTSSGMLDILLLCVLVYTNTLICIVYRLKQLLSLELFSFFLLWDWNSPWQRYSILASFHFISIPNETHSVARHGSCCLEIETQYTYFPLFCFLSLILVELDIIPVFPTLICAASSCSCSCCPRWPAPNISVSMLMWICSIGIILLL